VTWQVTLPCTRAEGERIEQGAELFADAEAPVLVATEETAERWRLDAYFERKPDGQVLNALLTLAPSAAGTRLKPRIAARRRRERWRSRWMRAALSGPGITRRRRAAWWRLMR
jgi:hypothetical protein